MRTLALWVLAAVVTIVSLLDAAHALPDPYCQANLPVRGGVRRGRGRCRQLQPGRSTEEEKRVNAALARDPSR
jgi:hypothetical protein